MKASRTSSRGRLHGSTVPAGRYVGTSCAHPHTCLRPCDWQGRCIARNTAFSQEAGTPPS